MGLLVAIPTAREKQDGYERLRVAKLAGFDVVTRHDVSEETLLPAAAAVDRCGWDPVRYLSTLGYGVTSPPSSPAALARAPRESGPLDSAEVEWLAEVASSVASRLDAGGDWGRYHLRELARLCYAGVALQATVVVRET